MKQKMSKMKLYTVEQLENLPYNEVRAMFDVILDKMDKAVTPEEKELVEEFSREGTTLARKLKIAPNVARINVKACQALHSSEIIMSVRLKKVFGF